MADKGWKSKGDKVSRRSPRKRGGKEPRRSPRTRGDMQPRRSPTKRVKTWSRPFKAPRAIVEVQDSDVQDSEVQDSESQVKIITEAENTRDIEARQVAEPHVIPFIKGIKMMSEREADECARHGEVLRWSPDSDIMETADTPGTTPEIFKSPEKTTDTRVPGSIVTDRVEEFEIDSR